MSSPPQTDSATRGRVRVERSPKWVRVFLGGVVVADSTDVRMVWEGPHYPVYYFPLADVRTDLLHATDEVRQSPSRGDAHLFDVRVGDRVASAAAYRHTESPIEELRELVAFTWSAMDQWFEEDEEVRVHARDPYTRIDTLPSSRPVRIEVDGVAIAESTHPTLLFETGLPTRYYLPKLDVNVDRLEPTDRSTACPYKGTARYWSVKIGDTVHPDIAWAYDYPLPESLRIAGLICFYNDRVDLFVDGVLSK
jgi:uncharacterized protein (DUF427 family)